MRNTIPRCLLVCLAVAFLPRGATAGDEDPWVGAEWIREATRASLAKICGSRVNVRAGPSVNYRNLDQLDDGVLLVVVEREEEWVRVRIPGGVPVHVFGALVERHESGLLARVRGDDVLMRGTPARGDLPLHDQRLSRDETLLVLEEVEGDGGAWLRALAPPRVVAWIYGKYVVPAPEVEHPSTALRQAARDRIDHLTDGRTRDARSVVRAAADATFQAEFARLGKARDAGYVTDLDVRAARDLVTTTDDPGQMVRARRLAAELARMRTEWVRKKDLENARRSQREIDARKRADTRRTARFEREMEQIGRPTPPSRPAPDGEGRIERRRGHFVLKRAGEPDLRLRSHRFRLADYVDRQVRVSGSGLSTGVLLVDFLEVVREVRS